ncbi:MAG: TPR end-of-group domain-containing protein [Planctomycetota bacterium]|jgi:tetratricopeptide (TPR) repeat protein
MFKGIQDCSRLAGLTDEEHETLRYEAEFFSAVLDARPGYLDALLPLAHTLTALGWYEAGLEIDQRICALCPDDCLAHYNLACSYSLTGGLDAALSTLEKACQLGYCDFEHIHSDDDLEAISGHPGLAALIDRYQGMMGADHE